MKILEDKKADAETDNQKANNAPNSEPENPPPSQEIDPEKVYLEQFSRTLGFQLSQLGEEPCPAKPRPRLNALSLTPSPSKENVLATKEAETATLPKKETKKKSAQTQARKGRLSRMMAVREDSDEEDSEEDDEDPFVKSTEVQTEDSELALPVVQSTDEREAKTTILEDGLQDYLVKIMHNMKLAMKAYVIEQQQELHNRITELESDTRKKDELIKHLRSQLRLQYRRTSSTFDEVSSIDPSSVSVSDTEDNESLCTRVEAEPAEEEPEEEEEEDRDLNEEEIRALQEKLKKQRKSWPTAVNLRRRRISKKSYSMDEDKQPEEEVSEADELWRIEFPAPSPGPTQKALSSSSMLITPIPERLAEDSSVPESEEEEEEVKEEAGDRFSEDRPGSSCNDWEVRMLVQQFERTQREQRRRHSSGEVLSWDKVLRLRGIAQLAGQQQQRVTGARHHRRKYSLFEGGPMDQWRGAGAPPLAQSSSHTSLLLEPRARASSKSPPRRKSVGQWAPAPPPGRKGSLPTGAGSSIGMSRWLSMDDAKSEGGSSLSSAYSQETVVGAGDSRFPSANDVRRRPSLGSSSPNVASDRDATDCFEAAPCPLPEWPSSPCLPTISEDEQPSSSSQAVASGGRSASLSALWPAARTFGRRRASEGQGRSSSTPDSLCGPRAVGGPSRDASSGNHSSSSAEASVVISIPEHEPLLSP